MRTIRESRGIMGTWVNGVRIQNEQGIVLLPAGPGSVLDRFN
jgi:hypothetical protein